MYGDTSVIRSWARRLREQGQEIQDEGDRLLARADAVHWSGLAADAMRASAHMLAGQLRACADQHREAAAALERHAAEVDRLEALIADVEHRVRGLLDRAARGVRSLVQHVAPEPLERPGLEHWAAGFVPPPPGSLAWLDVHVPGPP